MDVKRTFTIDDKGQVALPLAWREKYGLKPGDEVSYVETKDGGLVLVPKARVAMKALDEIAEALKDAGYTLDDLIEDGRDIRAELLKERYGLNG